MSSETRQIKQRMLIQRVGGWLRFKLLPSIVHGVTFSNYYPDSAFIMKLHPEMFTLLPRWLRGNRRNNGGDIGRLHALILNLKQLIAENIEGEFAELGVYRGNSAAILAHFAAISGRKVRLFDTFAGFNAKDLTGVDKGVPKKFEDTSIGYVRETVGNASNCEYIEGYFPDSLSKITTDCRYAFVHIDCDLYEPMQAALKYFYPRLSEGGILFLHDYSSGLWPGSSKAIQEFYAAVREYPILLPDKSGTAIIRKTNRNG